MMKVLDSIYLVGTVLGCYVEPEKINRSTGELYSKQSHKVQLLTAIPKDGESVKKEIHDLKVNDDLHVKFFESMDGKRVFVPVNSYAIKQENGTILQGYSIPRGVELQEFRGLVESSSVGFADNPPLNKPIQPPINAVKSPLDLPKTA